MRCGATSLSGWSDAASNAKSPIRLVLGPTSPTLEGPLHILQWAPTFPRKLVNREMADHKSLLCESYAPSGDMSLGTIGLGDCESPFFTHARGKFPKQIHSAHLRPATPAPDPRSHATAEVNPSTDYPFFLTYS